MADKQIGFVRVDEDTHAWLKDVAGKAGIPVTSAVRVLIGQARREGWQIERGGEPYRVITKPGPVVPYEGQ